MTRAPRHRLDVAELADVAGLDLGTSSWRVVGRLRVRRFAAVTGDRAVVHLSARAAGERGFSRPIAHGLLALSLGPRLLSELVFVDGTRILHYGYDRVRFPAPLIVPGRVRMRAQLAEVASVAAGTRVCFSTQIETSGQEKPACVADVVFV